MNKKRSSNSAENRLVRSLDKLADYDDFNTEIAPALRGLVKEGADPTHIFKVGAAAVAARMLTIALKEPDAARALTAMKDVLDRAQGKAVEKREVKMELEGLSDSDLDARLSELASDDSPSDESETLN